MSLKHYVNRLRSLPPDVIARKAATRLHRGAVEACHRLCDGLRPTYGTPASGTPGGLAAFLPPIPPDALPSSAPVLAGLAEQYLAHRFDLLGSGWVQVRHGMRCSGLEGFHYQMEGPVQADQQGRWLIGRINRANRREARRIFRLVDEGYVPIDWHLDFKSGYRWQEATWYRDILYGHRPGVDVKVPWELARMQHLPQLALAAGLARDGHPGLLPAETYVREFRNQALEFIATNPPRYGVNWATTMDVGIRIVNWLVAYDLFRAYGAAFDPAFVRELSRSTWQHGRHILENLEWAPDLRGNHYLANIAGLLFVAAYLPRTAETDAWLAFAVQELVAEVSTQFMPDGANFEASTCYHRLSAEMVVYATALVLGLPAEKRAALQQYDHRQHRGLPPLRPGPLPLYPTGTGGGETPFPAWYVERVERMAEFTLHITKPSGQVPQIGDNDNGRFLKLLPMCRPLTVSEARARYANLDAYSGLPDSAQYWDEDTLDHRHLAAAVGELFDRSDLAALAGGAGLDAWLVQQLAGDGRIISYCQRGGGRSAARVRVGTPEDWRRLGDMVATEPENQRHVQEIAVPGGGLREGLELYGYPDFGLYLFRSRRLYLAIRCGTVGQSGNGGHAHNDQLALELSIDGQDWITDPGTYLYTPLPERRNEYRSVAAHFAPRCGSREPGRLHLGLFQLGDESRAHCLYFGPEGFAGVHKGYGHPTYRLVALDDGALHVIDSGAPETGASEPASPPPPLSPKYGSRIR